MTFLFGRFQLMRYTADRKITHVPEIDNFLPEDFFSLSEWVSKFIHLSFNGQVVKLVLEIVFA